MISVLSVLLLLVPVVFGAVTVDDQSFGDDGHQHHLFTDDGEGWDHRTKMYFMEHTASHGTQHAKLHDDPKYFSTNSYMPLLPSTSGLMGTHGTYRFLTVHEQTAVFIGDGKHGVWRVQENGFIRNYLKEGKEGIFANTTKDMNKLDWNSSEDRMMLEILENSYAAFIPDVGIKGYKYPENKVNDDGYFNYIDLTIYHPLYNNKYDDHVPLDLPHWICTLPAPGIPNIQDTWRYAIHQPQANKIGPLGIRAGLDVKENYHNAIRFNLFGGAGIYANIGQDNAETDGVHKTLDDIRQRVQTLNYKKLDLTKTEHEIYLIERPFFNSLYIFVTVIFDNDAKEYSYIRPNGSYYEELQTRNVDLTGIPTTENHYPPVPIVNEPSPKKVFGTSVYGHHHPARRHHGLEGGACPARGGDMGTYPWGNGGTSWPTTYEEITPVCDGFVIDIKFFTDLDKSWNSESIFLGNGGQIPATVTNYTTDLNIYGRFEDPYLVNNGIKNPVELNWTSNGNYILSSDDAPSTETLQLDFGRAGEHLDFVEANETFNFYDEFQEERNNRLRDKDMMDRIRGHAGTKDTQHGKDKNATDYYTTNSQIPQLPSVSGYMGSHGTYRFVTVHEQTIFLIGDGKHGVWRVQDNGMIRNYLKKGMVGITNTTDPNALDANNPSHKLELDIIEKNYAAYIPEEGFSGYKYPDDKTSADGYLNFIDLTIYHPKYKGEYDNHVPIDLPHHICTMPQAGFPTIQNLWKYATAQPEANKPGPLAIRAGLDIKEHYRNMVRFNFLGDAGLWANVGTGNAETDHVTKTLDELRDRAQTLHFKKVDLSKMNFELYLIERPFFNLDYIFITIVMDNADGDYSYIRPDGPYYEALQAKGSDMNDILNDIPKAANHFPPMPIKDEAEKQNVIGLSVYGHHHPHRHHHGLYGGACPSKGGDLGRYPVGGANAGGGASWPNTYEEITPVCDGFLLDLKMFYDLDKSWDSENMFLGNAGFKPAQVTNYTVDINIYGQYTDQYLLDAGKVNPYRMDLTPDNQFVNSSDDAELVSETLQLDFNRAGDYLEFNEVEGLQPEIRKKVVEDTPKENELEEGDPMLYKFAIKDQDELYSCCSDEDVCTRQSCMKMEKDGVCYYPVTVRRHRSNCGHELTYRTLDMRAFYETKFLINFRPNKPVVKSAKYDSRTDCLIIELEPEDTGRCELKYSFVYNYNVHNRFNGELSGTKDKLEGVQLRSCFNETTYFPGANGGEGPSITIRATSTVSHKFYGDETTKNVEFFKSDDPEECPTKDD